MLSKVILGLLKWGLVGFVVGFVAGILGGIAKCRVGDVGCVWNNALAAARLCSFVAGLIGIVPPIIKESRRRNAAILLGFSAEGYERRRREEEETSRRRVREEGEAVTRLKDFLAAAELQRKKADLASLLTSARRDFLTLRELVQLADINLDAAEGNFAEEAFSPFWDEVENATNKLAAYDEGIRRVNDNAKDYKNRALKLSASEIPEFSLPAGKLPDARPVAQRLSEIVRKAQKNFQFAMIYEQRKTNQLLYAGFGSLGIAIYSLRDKLSQSLSALSESVNSSLQDLLWATNFQTATIGAAAEHQAQLARESEEAANARVEDLKKLGEELIDKEEEQSKMLDNIQRKRKP
jgi:uncharacterized phage infection (PIP) family protein YhgE